VGEELTVELGVVEWVNGVEGLRGVRNGRIDILCTYLEIVNNSITSPAI